MAWLRLDDGFTKHPKFEGWTPAQRWAWLEVMEYCARYRTRGRIPTDETLLPRSATRALLTKAEAAGWCERRADGALWIKDWDTYNPPELDADELQRRVEEALQEYPDASANEVARIVGGRRKAALEAIRRFRSGSALVPESGSRNRSGTGSRARGPVPSPRTVQGQPGRAAAEAQDTPSASTELQHAANGNGEHHQDPAAADQLEAPRLSAIRAAVDALEDHDSGTLAQVEHLAQTIPAQLFDQVVERVQRRIAAGNVANHSGLMVDLLRKASKDYRRSAIEAAAAVQKTPSEDVIADARQYAKRELPWDAAEHLITRKLARFGITADDQVAIVEQAADAYRAIVDEPDLATS